MNAKHKLKDNERKILSFIREANLNGKFVFSSRELANAMNVETKHLKYIIPSLIERGHIVKDGAKFIVNKGPRIYLLTEEILEEAEDMELAELRRRAIEDGIPAEELDDMDW